MDLVHGIYLIFSQTTWIIFQSLYETISFFYTNKVKNKRGSFETNTIRHYNKLFHISWWMMSTSFEMELKPTTLLHKWYQKLTLCCYFLQMGRYLHTFTFLEAFPQGAHGLVGLLAVVVPIQFLCQTCIKLISKTFFYQNKHHPVKRK